MTLFLRNLLFAILVPGTVAGYIPIALISTEPPSVSGFRVVGLVVVAAGAAVLLLCIRDFWIRGKGTPAPIDPPKVLVIQGLYRYVRNPMYIGALSVIVGEAILFSSSSIMIYAVGVGVMFHLFVILYEEPTLLRQFGAGYEEYKQSVPRWLP